MPPDSRRKPDAGRTGPAAAPGARPRPTRRPAARRSAPTGRQGTPSVVLALFVVVPVIAIGLILLIKNPFGADSRPVVTTVVDPNKDVNQLTDRFKSLEQNSKVALGGDRENVQFEVRIRGLIASWEKWMADFDRVFSSRKNADGSLPDEFWGYSKYKAAAGTYRLDLIKSGGF